MTRLTHHVVEPTSAEDAVPMPMTVRPLLGWWDATPAKFACGLNPIPKPKPCADTSMAAPGLALSSTLTSRTAIHLSFVRTPPFVTAGRNGHAMMTAMVFGKFIPTRSKACGPACAPSCVLSGAFINTILAATLLSTNLASI